MQVTLRLEKSPKAHLGLIFSSAGGESWARLDPRAGTPRVLAAAYSLRLGGRQAQPLSRVRAVGTPIGP